ncbi:MAG: beta-ketoacyl-[acyl-carrier-protein] synthase II [Anaerolinea sp.]|nr:beta-ketoacyl-[acyl-carrier-protein] synthase II [Anaerolinea sp.]
MRRRIVVTGIGCISPLANNWPETWKALVAGVSGVAPITKFDASRYKTRFAAEAKNFDPVALLGAKEARRMDRFTQFALAAGLQAVEHSGLKIDETNRDRVGVVIGTGIGGVSTMTEQLTVLAERGPDRVSPFLVPMMLADTAPGMLAIQLGIRGPNLAVITACATGSNAIGEAAELIRRGSADVVLAGGAEAAVIPLALAGLGAMNALSTRNDDPQRASRPFDRNRDGFVIGEGAAVLVLESLEYAQGRDAKILAEVTGYGTSDDAYHISAPAENGAGAALCMKLALENASLRPQDIDYINAHGTSTLLNDKSETAAIKTTFGAQAYIPVSSTKSMTGHLMGASGALEAAVCVQVIQEGLMPPTINYETPDPECDLDYVPNLARRKNVRHVMSNSFGFGGHNATLILSRFEI